jgi:glutathione S-transferase
MVEAEMAGRIWAVGDVFTMADCAAAAALFYAVKVMPRGATHLHAAGYLRRLMQRPSFARVLHEAEPYFRMFPAG